MLCAGRLQTGLSDVNANARRHESRGQYCCIGGAAIGCMAPGCCFSQLISARKEALSDLSGREGFGAGALLL